MRRAVLFFLFISFLLVGCSTEKECTAYSPEECPASCVVCPPCEVCSSISCQAEDFCAEMGFNRSWYEDIVVRIDERS